MSEYVCTLDKASVKKAAAELNEVPKEREAAVEALRQWVLQNSSWLKSPTDTKFLLAFLRNAKFVQLAARKRLVKFWTARSQNPQWFSNVDTRDERFAACIRMGVFVFLPKRDKDGRFFCLSRTGAMDVSGKYSLDDMMKAWMALIDYCLMDENLQVNGMVTVEDMSNLTIKHNTFIGVDDMRRSMDIFIRGYPVRYKAMHYYNVNPIFEAMFAIISPLLPEKLKKRVQFHGKNLADVYKCVDKTCLPSDYLPDDFKGETIGSTQDCIERNLTTLQSPEVHDYIRRLTGSEFGVDEARKPSDDELFTESFRKLNVD